MDTIITQGEPDEQKICVGCGFCCDATLFEYAHLNPGERGHLPGKIEENSYSKVGKDYFRLPCHYFSGKCTIYDRKRADVCGSYRCQLLTDFAAGKMSLQEALKIVGEAMQIRTSIIREYMTVYGGTAGVTFRRMMIEVGNTAADGSEEEQASADIKVFRGRCNIFEALLIKHFRSAEDFEKMIMK